MERNLPQPSQATLARLSKLNQQQLIPQYSQFLAQNQNRFDSEKIIEIKKVYQHGVCGKNDRGQTIVVDRLGNIKIQHLSKVLDEDELVSYLNQRLCQIAEECLGERQQVVWVIDLNGKIMQLASKKNMELLQTVIENAAKYFPGMLYRLVFVNTPMLFDTIWNKLTQFVPKSTLDKVVMIGEDLEDLYQFASPEILPAFLGGAVDEDAFLYGKSEQKEEEEQSEDEEVDFSSLKSALCGLKLSGGGGNKNPFNTNASVSQTPLNTQADK